MNNQSFKVRVYNLCLSFAFIFVWTLTYHGTKIFQYCTSDLQFLLVLQTFKSVCNKEHKGVIYDMTS